MLRKFLILLILISMALTMYSADLTMVITDEGTALSVTDVCSHKSQTGFMASPTVPAPMFTFIFDRPYENISIEENLIFSSIFATRIDRPPVV